MIENIGNVGNCRGKEADAVGDDLLVLIFPEVELVEDMLGENVFNGAGREFPVELLGPR